jgi:hypothetical protein
VARHAEIDALTRRVQQLEGQLAQLTHILAAAEPLLRDTNRLTELADYAGRLNEGIEAKLRDLRDQALPQGIGGPRFEVRLNTVYHADSPGYVSMVFYSGSTGAVRILAGPDDRPSEPVSFPGDQYVGGFIRRGEYWMVTPLRPGSSPSFDGIFTPLY